MPCLIPCAIDQDPCVVVRGGALPLTLALHCAVHSPLLPARPRVLTRAAFPAPPLRPTRASPSSYFRMTRDVAPKLGEMKPALIHSKFFPALQGHKTKMSASSASSAIFVSDTPDEISEKIKKYAYSGGGETLAEHKANGANLEVDVSYNWLRFFLEDDEELARIGEEYGSRRMMTGEVKEILITLLQGIVKKHQEGRAAVSDDLVKEFMSVRRLNFRRPGDQ